MLVDHGQAYRRTGPRHFEIDPTRPAHFDRLLSEVTAETPIASVVYLWGLDAGSEPLDEAELFLARAPLPLYLSQALVEHSARGPSRGLVLVTTGAQSVGSDAVACPEQAILWGFGRTASQEHPELGLALVDVDPPSVGFPERAAAAIRSELALPREPEVGWREGHRHTPHFTRHASAGRSTAPGGPAVITGGLGTIGLALAEWLVDRGVDRIALLGRSPPERVQEQRLQALSATGADVMVLQADVADASDLPPRVVPHPMLVPAPVEGREGRASSGTRATA